MTVQSYKKKDKNKVRSAPFQRQRIHGLRRRMAFIPTYKRDGQQAVAAKAPKQLVDDHVLGPDPSEPAKP